MSPYAPRRQLPPLKIPRDSPKQDTLTSMRSHSSDGRLRLLKRVDHMMEAQYRSSCARLARVVDAGSPYGAELTHILDFFKEYSSYLREGHFLSSIETLSRENQRLSQKLRGRSQPSKLPRLA